jgi:hypothetical protein
MGYLDDVKGYLGYLIHLLSGSSLSAMFSLRRIPYMHHQSHMMIPLYHFLHQISIMMSPVTPPLALIATGPVIPMHFYMVLASHS